MMYEIPLVKLITERTLIATSLRENIAADKAVISLLFNEPSLGEDNAAACVLNLV